MGFFLETLLGGLMANEVGTNGILYPLVLGGASIIASIVGAFFVNGAKSWFTVTFPEYWLYFLGAMFIAVTLFLPQGIVGLVRKLTDKASKGGAQ